MQIFCAFISCLLFLPAFSNATAYIQTQLYGQLGNQLFTVAAATSLAIDNGAIAIFPGFETKKLCDTKLNYKEIFFRVKTKPDNDFQVNATYAETYFHYEPIPYTPNMKLRGFFQSEKYFKHNKAQILALYAPSDSIVRYLTKKYRSIIDHPNSVAVHFRDFTIEVPADKFFKDIKINYYKQALSLFPNDALFVVFTNNPKRCREIFSKLPYEFIFIEGEKHFHDFYLMSFCKHNIICNSTFSWWAAYLNPNPDKIIICPKKWYNPSFVNDEMDLLPDEWIKL